MTLKKKRVMRNGKEYFYEAKSDSEKYKSIIVGEDKQVECLVCSAKFAGRSNVRICQKCKSSKNWSDGN